jgi:hypothetical protein
VSRRGRRECVLAAQSCTPRSLEKAGEAAMLLAPAASGQGLRQMVVAADFAGTGREHQQECLLVRRA